MSNIQIKNVDPELHEAARQRASSEGRTLGEYVLELIRKDLRKPARKEWLARAAAQPRTNITNDEILSALDEARAERAER